MGSKRAKSDKSSQTLGRRSQQLLAMVRIASTVLHCVELEEILTAITKELSLVIDFDRSSVAFRLPNKNFLVLRDIYKKGAKRGRFGEGRKIQLDEASVIGWVATHKEGIIRNDIEQDSRFQELVKEEGLKSDMIVPLISRGKLIGTLNVGSYRKNAFSRLDFEILQNCREIACLAIERALLLKEAKELGQRYRTLQENANDVIMLIDRNTGKLIEVNRKCERVLGYSRDELLKRSYFDLFPREDQYQARRDFINVLSQKSNSFVDRRMISKEGSIIFVDINASLVELEDDIFLQIIVHDISQRKMMEQQIILQNKNLQEVNKKLREVDRMKTEFLANISHELRTPLSIIIAYSESLRSNDLSREEQLRFLDVIAENGEHLLDLINNLLDLSKLEISNTMLNITLSHIHDVIKSVWMSAEQVAKRKNIKISFHPGYDIPVIYFDNNQILRVISCLINNAIKFTEDGGEVQVRTSLEGEEVWVRVIDTGMGIPTEEIPNIFDTFRQVDGSSSRRWGGLGIGLALAKHIVEMHRGRLWVESEYGRGSVFTFSLPVESEEAFLLKTPLRKGEQGKGRGLLR